MSFTRRSKPLLVACSLTLLALAALAARSRAQGSSAGLLAGRDPVESEDATGLDRLTDGIAAEEGDFWLTDKTSHLSSRKSHVDWDLGSVQPVRCAFIQGDNDDSYHFLGSRDGKYWTPLWTAGPASGAGMRVRSGKLEGEARYVRLVANGGDGRYAVGEVGVFSSCPTPWPPELDHRVGMSLVDAAQGKIIVLALALMGFVLLHDRRAGRGKHLLVLVPLVIGVSLAIDLAELYPLWEVESLLRATIAAVACVLVLKEAFSPADRAPDPRFSKSILGVLALAAFGCYYHFGALQFPDHLKGRQTLVHTWDMRHYFPVAKYFREIRFDGLYAGQLAAYVDISGEPIEKVAHVRFRDLRSSDMRATSEMVDHIREVKARFSPERWEEWKRDMKYFIDAMGPNDYLGGMRDHGGNATPVWVFGAWLLFAKAPANELTLTLAGLIDPLLVLVLFAVVWRTFGLRTMLYVAILFGATDFYQFGSNLMGSTLRQDWLVALGFGACAIKRGRYALGGALIAYGGLIRAFPAVATFFLAVPIVWWLVDWFRQKRGALSLRALRDENRGPIRAMVGATAAVLLSLVVTSALFGLDGAWGNWFRKIEIHATGPSVNNVGLRNVLMFEPEHSSKRVINPSHAEPWDDWQRYQVEAFARRRVWFYLINAVFAGMVVLAARRRPLEQTTLLGLLLIPFLFYPSNYYCHFIFLLPMAAASRSPEDPRDRSFAIGTAALLALCVGQYFTLEQHASDLRYTYQSFLLLAGMVAFAWPLVEERWRELRGVREDDEEEENDEEDESAEDEARSPEPA